MEQIFEVDTQENTPISMKQYDENSKFTNCDIDIATVEFRESTTNEICAQFDLDTFMERDD